VPGAPPGGGPFRRGPRADRVHSADVYDALTTRRTYKASHTPEAAIAELYHQVARGWRRRDLVDAFVRVLQDRGRGAGAAADT
jgi:HD-GYP domain-containing protein (c-di-GMP phosphodiesterase class II)